MQSRIRFGLIGEKRVSPAPTLFIFATNIECALTVDCFSRIGNIVREHGYICVSMHLPCHLGLGSLPLEPNTPEGLEGWASTISRGENFVSQFTSEVSNVLDYLVNEGFSDPEKVAVAGTSRGGFIAMHAAAADARFRCALGFAPLTDLTELLEFTNLKDNKLANSLSLINLTKCLVGRSIWVSIGNNDNRVNTDKAIEFVRKVTAASDIHQRLTPELAIDNELHVMPWPGHGCDVSAHDFAASWLMKRMGEGFSPQSEETSEIQWHDLQMSR